MLVKGWASTADQDLGGHVVAAGAFTASIKAKGLNGPRGIKLLKAHDTRQPIGRITKLETRNSGLWLEALIDEGISYAADLAQAIRANGGLSFSVGFFVRDADVAKDSRGQEYLLITKGDLFEVSAVVEPANPNAIMTDWKD